MPKPIRCFVLPRGRRVRPGWIALSLAVHLIGAFLLTSYSSPWRGRDPNQTLTWLLDIAPASGAPVFPERQVDVATPRGRGAPLVFDPRNRRLAAAPAVIGPGAATGDTASVLRRGPSDAERLAALQPRRGDPRLWVRPMVIPEGGGPPLDMDSIVRARLFAMADSLERNRDGGYRPWTFMRNGKKWGLDGAGLHLGGVTIPAIALALLPLPSGNIDQSRANAVLNERRAEILRAAARAQAEEDFRRAVIGIRERWNREREERRGREPDRPTTVP